MRGKAHTESVRATIGLTSGKEQLFSQDRFASLRCRAVGGGVLSRLAA